MISFDLRCSYDHVFEVWFRSGADYEEQQKRRLIACPVCGNDAVTKAAMAPAVAAKGNRTPSPGARGAAEHVLGGGSGQVMATTPLPTAGPPMSPEMATALAAIARIQAEVLPSSRWVGRDFAREARALHAQPTDGGVPAMIHGQATADEADALAQDGIAVMPLLVPTVPPEAQN